jgi:hypothetical protein
MTLILKVMKPIIYFLTITIALLAGCTSNNTKTVSQQPASAKDSGTVANAAATPKTVDTTTEANPVVINFILPSPDEILTEIISEDIKIDPQLVNPRGNAEKYLETKQQAMNLGVYLTDFAYININTNKTNGLEYFKLIRNLAQKLNIYGIFSETMYGRIRKNMTNKDSLNAISKDMYYEMLGVLENSNRNNIYALVASGALIESLYLSTMAVTDYAKYQAIAQKIFEQKFVFNNFYEFASQYKSDKDVKAVLVLFDELKSNLNNAGSKKTEKKVTKDGKDHITFGGGDEIVLNEKVFTSFKDKVIKTRKEIISVATK